MPKISVVVPTYQRPHFLRQALASLQAQTFGDFEVMVCDNDNSDEVAGIIAELDDSRFRHVRRPTNIGMLPNALQGLQAATGEFVFKFDDDDVLEPTCFDALVGGLAQSPEATVVFSHLRLVDLDLVPRPEIQIEAERYNHFAATRAGEHRPFTDLVLEGTVTLAGAMVRRTAVDWHAVPAEVATAYDFHILLDAARDGASAVYVKEHLVKYRVHPGADSSTQWGRQLRGRIVALEHAAAAARHDDLTGIQRHLAAAHLRLGRELVRAGEHLDAARVLVRAMAASPSVPAARLLVLACAPKRLSQALMSGRTTHTAGRAPAQAG